MIIFQTTDNPKAERVAVNPQHIVSFTANTFGGCRLFLSDQRHLDVFHSFKDVCTALGFEPVSLAIKRREAPSDD